MELQGKNVIITGASTGIGFELMTMLLDQGCKVMAASRTISTIKAEHENLHKFDCDVSSSEGVDRLFDFALTKFKSIDIFVANAGFAFFEEMDAPDWEHYLKIFNINVFSAFYAAQKMKELNGQRPFNFIITASGMSFFSLPGYSMYSSTKAAVRGFADSYRYELSKGQFIQCVYPIATKTPFFQNAGGIPMAWPVQSVEHVAKKIIKGIRKNRNHIFPSKLFRLFNVLAALCPPIVKIYNIPNERKFRHYLDGNQ